jgi:hypothetical protein
MVLSLLRTNQLPKKSYAHSRQRTYVASLIQSAESGFTPPKSPDIRPLYSAERLVIKVSFESQVLPNSCDRNAAESA